MDSPNPNGTRPVSTNLLSLRSVELSSPASSTRQQRERLVFAPETHVDDWAEVATPATEPAVFSRTHELRDHKLALQQTAVDYATYSKKISGLFTPPPVVPPAHLCNDFSKDNMIVARDHLGREDLPHSYRAQERESLRTLELEEDQEGTGEGKEVKDDRFEQRFRISSLPNGDLLELDAKRGCRYWEKESPAVFPQLIPSQLLSEREAEECFKFRFYSRRWGEMLKELAATVGGEDGAELMRKYEAREETHPLAPKFRRAFYESVVNYDKALDDQAKMLEGIEEDYEQYVAQLVDAPQGGET